jgi:hypothetical protein
MPAMVLINPDDAGVFLRKPKTQEEIDMGAFWKERAFVYIMSTKSSEKLIIMF